MFYLLPLLLLDQDPNILRVIIGGVKLEPDGSEENGSGEDTTSMVAEQVC